MKLSIITINYNNLEGLKQTLSSVECQTKAPFEHVIIDGGSTDGGKEYIQEYASRVSYPVVWVSERDGGIYNAMNKGAQKAGGEYVWYMNSGDWLPTNNVVEQIHNQSIQADIIIGRVNQVRNNSIVKPDYTVKGELTLFNHFLWGVPHQGVLMRRQVQLDYPYDEHYKISSDFGFFLQTIIINNCSVQYMSLTIANYDLSGVSSTNTVLLQKERVEIYEKYVPANIRKDYDRIFPYYYEMIRLMWLLRHPFWYRVYRSWTTLGMKLFK